MELELHKSEVLNEYLKKVISLDDVRFRRKIVELGRVVDAYRNGTDYEEVVELEDLRCDEIVEYLEKTYKLSKILDEFDNEDLKEHIIDDYFIAEDEEAAAEILIDSDNIKIPFKWTGRNLPDFRKHDCISLIEQIADREGWNHLYNLLESEKDRLGLI